MDQDQNQNLLTMEFFNRIIKLENEVKDLKAKIAYMENQVPSVKPKTSKKYMNLTNYLKDLDEDYVSLSFEDIENILGFKLPDSAKRQSFWSNSTSHSFALSWLSAGFKARIMLEDKRVEFKRQNSDKKD